LAEPKQITTEEMEKLLANETRMSPPTRHVLVTGQSVYVDADGQAYQAPLTHVDTGATHHMNAVVDPVLTYGAEKCKLS
jgi:hypothetical protein